MSKQISVKSISAVEAPLKDMYIESQKYLENIGFRKTPMMSVTDKENTYRMYLFSQGNEKVILEYKKDMFEEVIKLVFDPLNIKFVYDILLMRFNQLASDNRERIFIYNE